MKLRHPKRGRVIEVAPERAAMYRASGWVDATPDAPAGNASLATWQEFARTKGFTDEDIDGKSRDDLRAALS